MGCFFPPGSSYGVYFSPNQLLGRGLKLPKFRGSVEKNNVVHCYRSAHEKKTKQSGSTVKPNQSLKLAPVGLTYDSTKTD